MKILAIETSCDETAVALLECIEDANRMRFKVLGNALLSQIDIHKEYGGVFPALAKRAHAENLVPLLASALEEAELVHEDTQAIPEKVQAAIGTLLEREPGLAEKFFAYVGETEAPDIDAIAVTAGPGLEPALWVGVNFAKALSLLWNKPLVPVNHLEGHILSSLLTSPHEGEYALVPPALPLLALVISGGHTELDLMHEWLSYKRVGETRDDAVGEAYDKVARMLGLPYPGGPEMSRLAAEARTKEYPEHFTLPRPMLDSGTCDFSFSGLKTAVMYQLKARPELNEEERGALIREFDNAVADVLWKKASHALDESYANTLVLGGGVSAAAHVREVFSERMRADYPHVSFHLPSRELTGDNAVMIAVAGYYRFARNEFADIETLRANGNLSLA